ncbi:hypothetical protein ABT297_18420 [Dactylosporangium sp. NPDC000555]|uniref:hypothetical protein n=1 Tax=Dactylosporangium sp. NPDC000555 TaxID=3154260 RepID=UPI00331740F0
MYQGVHEHSVIKANRTRRVALAGAARWAAAEAARRGAPPRIVMAPRGGLADTGRHLAEMLVADVVRDVEAVAPGSAPSGNAAGVRPPLARRPDQPGQRFR